MKTAVMQWKLEVAGCDAMEFDSRDIAGFPLPYADECAKLEAMKVGERIPFGRGIVERLADEAES